MYPGDALATYQTPATAGLYSLDVLGQVELAAFEQHHANRRNVIIIFVKAKRLAPHKYLELAF